MVVVPVVLCLFVAWLLGRTMFGRAVYAIGGDPEAARRAGFRVARTQLTVYVLVGMMAALGGLVFVIMGRSASPQDLVGGELDIIAAVVLGGASIFGGRGSVLGTVLGVLLVQVINNSLILAGRPQRLAADRRRPAAHRRGGRPGAGRQAGRDHRARPRRAGGPRMSATTRTADPQPGTGRRRPSAASGSVVGRLQVDRRLGRMAVLLVVAFAFFAVQRPGVFLNPINLQNIMVATPEIGVLALAMTLAMLTGGIDLSLVAVANLSAITMSMTFTAIAASDPARAEQSAPLLVVVGAAVGLACGLVNGLLVSRLGITPILATLGTMQVFNGLAIVWTGGSVLYGSPEVLTATGRSTVAGVPVLFVVFLLVAVAVAVLVNRTPVGLKIQLQGANPVAARYSGVDSRSVLMRTYLLTGPARRRRRRPVPHPQPHRVRGLRRLVRAARHRHRGPRGHQPQRRLRDGGRGRARRADPADRRQRLHRHPAVELPLRHRAGGHPHRGDGERPGALAPPGPPAAHRRPGRERHRDRVRRPLTPPPRPAPPASRRDTMKKIINDPSAFVDEFVDGILLAHPDLLKVPGDDRRILVRADAPVAGKVGIVTGGGSGHLPLFKGYVGAGLCSGVAIGNVFSSPSSQQVFEATKAVDGGAGVLYLYGNYGGDVFNFDLAADLAELEGIETATVLGRDDVASQPNERKTDRRGVAGIFFAYKAAGAAAERGDSLADVAAVAEDVVEHTATMGIGLSPDHPADHPAAQLRPARRGDGDRDRHPRRARHPPRPARDGRRDRRAASASPWSRTSA